MFQTWKFDRGARRKLEQIGGVVVCVTLRLMTGEPSMTETSRTTDHDTVRD